MGLDAVELLLATEQEFQVALSDEEASKCNTPDMLTDLVYSKLRKSESEICPSMHGFYVIRKSMMDYFSLPREKIRPDSKLDDLIPKKNRGEIWKDYLRNLSDGKTMYAPLAKPSWVKYLLVVVTLIIFLIIFVVTENVFLSGIISTIVAVIIQAATVSLKVEFPSDFNKVKDLIRIVSALDATIWNRDAVYDRVKKLVVEQLGVKESDVHPNSHFVDDLGMG